MSRRELDLGHDRGRARHTVFGLGLVATTVPLASRTPSTSTVVRWPRRRTSFRKEVEAVVRTAVPATVKVSAGILT
jgi:hypothetical protein